MCNKKISLKTNLTFSFVLAIFSENHIMKNQNMITPLLYFEPSNNVKKLSCNL
jgi:hypothetical protein